VDKPVDQAVAIATAEIIDLINEREPRAVVKEVEYTGIGDEGNMEFRVVVEI
jgi:predicted secreted protein